MAKQSYLSPNEPVIPQGLLEIAKARGAQKIVIARPENAPSLLAVRDAEQLGLISPILVGQRAAIHAIAKQIDYDISHLEFIEATGEQEAARASFIAALERNAHAVMKGHLHTDTFMRAALNREYGIRTKSRLVHVFYLTFDATGTGLFISDAALNISPDFETQKSAVIAVTKLAQSIGIARPRIGVLSASESILEGLPSTSSAQKLAAWAQNTIDEDDTIDADVAGPMAIDVLLSDQAAQIKGISNAVAGRADAIIVPDIVSGNSIYKLLVLTTSACAAGLVLGGRIPLILTSRAEPYQGRIASIALASCVTI